MSDSAHGVGSSAPPRANAAAPVTPDASAREAALARDVARRRRVRRDAGARASDRTIAAPLDASGAITWLAVAAAVIALGQVLGRPVTVVGLALGAFAGLSYLACVRLAGERAALVRARRSDTRTCS